MIKAGPFEILPHRLRSMGCCLETLEDILWMKYLVVEIASRMECCFIGSVADRLPKQPTTYNRWAMHGHYSKIKHSPIIRHNSNTGQDPPFTYSRAFVHSFDISSLFPDPWKGKQSIQGFIRGSSVLSISYVPTRSFIHCWLFLGLSRFFFILLWPSHYHLLIISE